MAYEEKVLVEALENLGITMWVEQQPFGKQKNGDLVGRPKCTNCERPFDMGITFGGNGSLCRECLDNLRQLLFKLVRQEFPEIDRLERPGARDDEDVE
jgi:hypothetical protein